MRVLIANEPRTYREIFARAFRYLRPGIEALVVEPEALEREAFRVRPDLVICDSITSAVEAATRFWVEYRVEDKTIAAASNACALPHPVDVKLDDLLAIIDRIEEEDRHHCALPRGP